MSAVPLPPPISTGPREVFPVQMGTKAPNYRDFGPHILPSEAGVEVPPADPKGAVAISSSWEVTQPNVPSDEQTENQATLPLEPPEQETVPTSSTLLPPPALTAGGTSPKSSSPTG